MLASASPRPIARADQRSVARVHLVALLIALLQSDHVQAQQVPPVTTAPVTPAPTTAAALAAAWVQHPVLPGERLQEIAARYEVEPQDIIRWNDLDPVRPLIRVGRSLRIYAVDPPAPRVKLSYRIRPGDTWTRIARAHNVDSKHLRKHWNPKMGAVLRAGEHLTLWIEDETSEGDDNARSVAAIEASGRSQSIGKPTRGRILGLAQLPVRAELYTVRNANHSYGSTHAITLIQQGVTTFRQRSGFRGELTIGDMSQRHGGRFRPHRSHQSGRDVDIRLPLRAGIAAGTIPERSDQVDWDVTWKLVRAMLDTGQVVFIFLSSTRQKHLYEAALRAGTPVEMLDDLIQYPRRAATAILRHSRGHTKHIHVRFTCGPEETRCRD